MEAGEGAGAAASAGASDARPQISVAGDDMAAVDGRSGASQHNHGREQGAVASPTREYNSPSMHPAPSVNLRSPSFMSSVTLGGSATPSSRVSTSTAGDSGMAVCVEEGLGLGRHVLA